MPRGQSIVQLIQTSLRLNLSRSFCFRIIILRLRTSHLLAAARNVRKSRLFVGFVFLLLKNRFWNLSSLVSEMASC